MWGKARQWTQPRDWKRSQYEGQGMGMQKEQGSQQQDIMKEVDEIRAQLEREKLNLQQTQKGGQGTQPTERGQDELQNIHGALQFLTERMALKFQQQPGTVPSQYFLFKALNDLRPLTQAITTSSSFRKILRKLNLLMLAILADQPQERGWYGKEEQGKMQEFGREFGPQQGKYSQEFGPEQGRPGYGGRTQEYGQSYGTEQGRTQAYGQGSEQGTTQQYGQGYGPEQGRTQQYGQGYGPEQGRTQQYGQGMGPEQGRTQQYGQGMGPEQGRTQQYGQGMGPEQGRSQQYGQGMGPEQGRTQQYGQGFGPEQGRTQQYGQGMGPEQGRTQQYGQGFGPEQGRTQQYGQGMGPEQGRTQQYGQGFGTEQARTPGYGTEQGRPQYGTEQGRYGVERGGYGREFGQRTEGERPEEEDEDIARSKHAPAGTEHTGITFHILFGGRKYGFLDERLDDSQILQITERLQNVMVDIASDENMRQNVFQLLDLAYNLHNEPPKSVQQQQGYDPEVQRSMDSVINNMKLLLSRFTSNHNMDSLQSRHEELRRITYEDEGLHRDWRTMLDFLQDSLSDVEFVKNDSWKSNAEDVIRRVRRHLFYYRKPLFDFIQEVDSFITDLREDHTMKRFSGPSRKLGREQMYDMDGRPGLRPDALRQFKNVIWPAVQQQIQFTTIPDIEGKDQDMTYHVSNVALRTKDVLPDTIDVSNSKHLKLSGGKMETENAVIALHVTIKGIRIVADQLCVKYKRQSLPDEGRLNVMVAGKMDLELWLSGDTEDDNKFHVDDANCELSCLRFSDAKVKKNEFLYYFFKPVLQFMIRKKLEKQVEDKLMRTLIVPEQTKISQFGSMQSEIRK